MFDETHKPTFICAVFCTGLAVLCLILARCTDDTDAPIYCINIASGSIAQALGYWLNFLLNAKQDYGRIRYGLCFAVTAAALLLVAGAGLLVNGWFGFFFGLFCYICIVPGIFITCLLNLIILLGSKLLHTLS